MRFVGFVAAGLLVGGLTVPEATSAAASPSAHGETSWQSAIARVQPSHRGCYHASYPSLQWHATPCRVAPTWPLVPAAQSGAPGGPLTVGNGDDYVAQVTGTISAAIGSFDDVSPKITEKGQVAGKGPKIANVFSLQLNTEFFSSTPACSGSGNLAKCKGWQQFVYDSFSTSNSVFMQYWLINYDAACPSRWFTYEVSTTTTDCYTNSPASPYPGGNLTASDLATTQLEGIASSGGNDEVSLSVGSGQATLVTNSDSLLDLAASWNTTEFGVFGDGSGDKAYFGAKTTLEAQTTLSNSSSSAPTCVEGGFTAETNNLKLTATPTISPQASPTMVSKQTDSKAASSSCAVAGGSG